MAAYDESVSIAHRALLAAQAAKDFDTEVSLSFGLQLAYHALGEYPRSIDFGESVMSSMDENEVQKRFGSVGLLSVLSRG